MIEFSWSKKKNNRLKADKIWGVCFEDVVSAIENGGLLDDVAHPNKMKYPHQRILVVLFQVMFTQCHTFVRMMVFDF